MSIPPYFMVFDVESVGLHGEGFAVGFVVVDPQGTEHARRLIACRPEDAKGDDAGRAWVAANVPDFRDSTGLYGNPSEVRGVVWSEWMAWKAKGALLAADCAWPVEARFLIACVDDDPADRTWNGPYPLHEIASFMAAAGRDPMATYERRDDELPTHHPLADARQSARLLIESLKAKAFL